MRKGKFLLKLLILIGFAVIMTNPLPVRGYADDQPSLPKVWQIVWSNDVSLSHLQELRAIGFDGLFKCVAYAPNYPDQPIDAGGEWRLVERVEGQYDWSSLQDCLDNALQANMWFIPEIVINVPPDWLLQQYPDSLLEDSGGTTATDPDSAGAPYLLSPWFIESGAADAKLRAFINAFLAVVSQYPNVPAVMIGNFKLNVLPWKMGTDPADDNFTYWPIWDDYAKTSFENRFGAGQLPPATWSDYQSMSPSEKIAFKDWLTSAMEVNLETRYLPWLSSFNGWKVVNASIWDADSVRGSVFTTMTPEMAAAKQSAIVSSGVSMVMINDDNMGDCGLAQMHQQDIDLAHSNGFLILGERVPGICTWAGLYNMWQNFDPAADGFINIGDPNAYWVGQFRTLYGEPSEPLEDLFLPLVLR